MIDLSLFSAVIFDFDGVLIDSETLQADAWRVVAREMGLKDFKVNLHQTAGRMDRHIAPELFPGASDVEAIIKRRWAVQDEMEARGLMKPIAGAVELLKHLSQTHRLAIASSSWPEKIERWLATHDLHRYFQAIVACGNEI